METNYCEMNRISTAMLLAAGTGSRLHPLTDDAPKCMTEVNGTTILERLVEGLCKWDIERLVVVVGHQADRLRNYLNGLDSGLEIEFVYADQYRTTNNIYSLWEARYAIQDPFLLLECDLVFDDDLLGEMLETDRMAVSHLLPWMNGTTVSLDHAGQVDGFHVDHDQPGAESRLKTVNMYSFSRASWRRVVRRLEQSISAGRVKDYYETVFAEMVAAGELSFEAVFFDQQRWYEIDTLEDLREAERLFPACDQRSRSGLVGS